MTRVVNGEVIQDMRIVSLVPSWTETLLDCEVKLVGRTKFCLYPKDQVENIPIVGGTKNWNLELVRKLSPDLVIFDKEENTSQMAQECPCPWISSQMTSIQELPSQLKFFSEHLKNDQLSSLSLRATQVVTQQRKPQDLLKSPFMKQWIGRSQYEDLSFSLDPGLKVKYVIWKNPWMAVAENTYIGSVLELFQFKNFSTGPLRYPKFEIESDDKENTLYFFSSEPFPFEKNIEQLLSLDLKYAAVVDGEVLSWYGSRSLRFLEQVKRQST